MPKKSAKPKKTAKTPVEPQAKKRGGGRPSKYQGVDLEQIKELASNGYVDAEIGKIIGVSTASFCEWKHKHPEFVEALEEGKKVALAKVWRALQERAIGYKHKSVKMFCHEGSVITEEYIEHYPPDVGAIKTFLGQRCPDYVPESQKVEMSGQVAYVIEIKKEDILP